MSMRIVKNGDVHVSVPYGVPKDMVEKFIDDNRQWIVKARQRLSEHQEQSDSFFSQLPLSTRQEREEVLRRMREIIPPLVERHARVMGVQPKTIYYSATTSRWGVCYPKRGRIGFSVYLLLLPDWCIEHVVVHELCHMLEPSHNARFHALMDRFFPRWREARAETRRVSRAAVSDDDDENA